jgi:flagellar motor switch protein FliN/FliY
MADEDDDAGKKKGKDVSPLALNEIEEDSRGKKTDGADDAWDDPPADIPDKPRSAQDLEAVYDIPVRVSAVLGKSSMQVNELLKLGRGAVVELDRKVGEAIDIYVNDRLVARGEVVVVDDRLGITMTEIIKTQQK